LTWRHKTPKPTQSLIPRTGPQNDPARSRHKLQASIKLTRRLHLSSKSTMSKSEVRCRRRAGRQKTHRGDFSNRPRRVDEAYIETPAGLSSALLRISVRFVAIARKGAAAGCDDAFGIASKAAENQQNCPLTTLTAHPAVVILWNACQDCCVRQHKVAPSPVLKETSPGAAPTAAARPGRIGRTGNRSVGGASRPAFIRIVARALPRQGVLQALLTKVVPSRETGEMAGPTKGDDRYGD